MKVIETASNNLLVQACKLYLQFEVFVTELKVLAFFTKKVTLPLLHCVAKGSQEALIQYLPSLWQDLSEGKMETLNYFQVRFF